MDEKIKPCDIAGCSNPRLTHNRHCEEHYEPYNRDWYFEQNPSSREAIKIVQQRWKEKMEAEKKKSRSSRRR